MSKRDRGLLIGAAVLAVLVFVMLFGVKTDKEKTDTFKVVKSDFEEVNEYLLSLEHREIVYSLLENEKGEIYGIGGVDIQDIVPPDEITEALNITKTIFTTEYSCISVKDNRINYYGLGGYMYVYSIDGKRPRYFYDREDSGFGVFSTYKLDKNWYLLVRKAR